VKGEDQNIYTYLKGRQREERERRGEERGRPS
jgi:hypothetical protein